MAITCLYIGVVYPAKQLYNSVNGLTVYKVLGPADHEYYYVIKYTRH